MTNDVFISLKEAQSLYGIEKTTFKRPSYAAEGICMWCGKQSSNGSPFCSKKCEKTYNFELKWSLRSTNMYRENILRRDGYICQKCGTPHMLINEHGMKIPVADGALQVHHIVPRSTGGDDNPDNLITWCKDCHDKYHKEHKNGFGPKI